MYARVGNAPASIAPRARRSSTPSTPPSSHKPLPPPSSSSSSSSSDDERPRHAPASDRRARAVQTTRGHSAYSRTRRTQRRRRGLDPRAARRARLLWGGWLGGWWVVGMCGCERLMYIQQLHIYVHSLFLPVLLLPVQGRGEGARLGAQQRRCQGGQRPCDCVLIIGLVRDDVSLNPLHASPLPSTKTPPS